MPASGHPVTLRTTSPHAPFGERPIASSVSHDLRQRLDGEPVELDVLPHRDVGEVARVLAGEIGDDAELRGVMMPIGDADAHHEVLGGLALAARAADCAHSVALGINPHHLK